MAKRKTLPQLVEEQNQLAAPGRPLGPEEVPGGATVRVLVESIYNGPGHKSIGRCAVGSIVTVAGGWYVQSLIKDGLVTRDLGAPE